jgi:hypothetical protein
MSLNRFNQWRKFVTFINKDPTLMHDGKQDPWWEFSGAVDEFNQHRLRCILHSLRLIEDDSMSAWVPRTTPTGGLPNISCIDQNPEPPPAVTLAERVLTDAQGGLHHQCSYPVGGVRFV